MPRRAGWVIRHLGAASRVPTRRVALFAALALLPGVGPVSAWAQARIPLIDACRYADDAAAQAAWRPMGATAPARAGEVAGRAALRLRCNFADTTIDRASWDRAVQVDLAECRGIRFRFLCTNTRPVSGFTIYFRSGEGWYAAGFAPAPSTAWTTVEIDKAEVRTEGRPTGWAAIDTIRVSAWRGGAVDTEFWLSDLDSVGLLGQDARVAIVRGDSLARTHPTEVASVDQYTRSVAAVLRELGIGYATLSDTDLWPEHLARARLVVLPHNPALPEPAARALHGYLAQGGKLLVFYVVPAGLRAAVPVEVGGHVKAPRPGYFAALRFRDGAPAGAPAVVGQASWNIMDLKPRAGAGRVWADWLDAAGEPTGYAAIVGSSNCVVMGHVLLRDDPANKRRMVRALVGELVPAVWEESATASIGALGQLAGYTDFAQATAGIAAAGRRDRRVRALVAQARAAREQALAARARGAFPAACDAAAAAAEALLRAHGAAQRPQAGEFRAWWCHSALGVEGLTWDQAAERLADNGFTAVLPNMLWGGSAFYPSEVLPIAPEVAAQGDQVAACVAAARKHGLQVHVWKVNWHLGGRTPPEFVAKLRAADRLQANARGEELLWLCPSHPDNRRLEIESMVEVARRYDVDGLHFDYIRYPDAAHCFCAGCRERFERTTGGAVARWPADVLDGGSRRQAWLEWRRANITAVVKAVSEQARALKPQLQLSAAVFRNWEVDRDQVGQDWRAWCAAGYLDFVCPMDYTAGDVQFENWVVQQKQWAGATPCYPGIGVSSSSATLKPDQVIAQITITRRHQTGGFVLFNYGPSEARDLVPLLGLGITAPAARPGRP